MGGKEVLEKDSWNLVLFWSHVILVGCGRRVQLFQDEWVCSVNTITNFCLLYSWPLVRGLCLGDILVGRGLCRGVALKKDSAMDVDVDMNLV